MTTQTLAPDHAMGGIALPSLTLHQFWASAIAARIKRCETRGWATRYRGPLAIHAAKSIPAYAREAAQDTDVAPVLAEGGLADLDALPLGAVVAVACLVDCVPTERVSAGMQHAYSPTEGARPSCLWIPWTERVMGNYEPERFAWVLGGIRPLREPVPAKGAQGLWQWRVPPSVQELLAERGLREKR